MLQSAVAQQAVTSLTLMNADTDQPIAGHDPFTSGATLDLNTLPTRNLNIRANTNPDPVGSVRFAYDGNANFRTESTAPYAFAGDGSGDYFDWTPTVGSHSVIATPFTAASGGGTAGTALTVNFTVTDSGSGGGGGVTPTEDTVDCGQLPLSIAPQASYTVNVPYTATESRDVVVEFWDAGWLGQSTQTVDPGTGTASISITLNGGAPTAGSNYLWKASIRPVGANWMENIDACNSTAVTVTSAGGGGGGGGGSTGAWLEQNGIVVIEPENGDLLSDWVARPTTHPGDPSMAGSLGNGWLEWTGAQSFGNTLSESQVNGILTYNFVIETEGVYYFRWRSKQYNVGTFDSGNDNFVNFATGTPVSGFQDFGQFHKVWVQSKQDWSWRTTFEPHHGDHYADNLIRRYYTPGVHTIRIAARSPGHSIDRIVLFHESVDFNQSAFESAAESPRDGSGGGGGSDLVFDAREDFPSLDSGEVPYYVDNTYNALAINAGNVNYRDKFARAELTFDGDSDEYDVTITTVVEYDGESIYRLLINGTQVATYTNPRVDEAGDLQPNTHTWSGITINNGDTIAIESNTASNGLIPEDDAFAWARGRWRQLELTPTVGPPPPSSAQSTTSAGIYGEDDGNGNYKKWHRVTVAFEGPSTSETANPNPFTDYRLNVTFTHPGTGKSYLVPGYYAADGNAGETSATSGNIWRVHFSPDETGTWNYTASFRTGTNVAVNGSPTAGTATSFDGANGSFDVVASDKAGRDFRGKGRLQYDGTRYLKFAENGEPFLKTGADAPENFLNCTDFDGTYNHGGTSYLKDWGAHAQDWNQGDPTWKGGIGKGIIGAVNYLASEGQNVFSFLTYNAGGDSKDVWMYTAHDNPLRFDCSKLDQWEIVFTHADVTGMYLHFKTQETENDDLNGPGGAFALDDGNLGNERKLYYRELMARFGHHLALNWNLGEENTQTTAQEQDMALYFHDNDPYSHHIVLHTYPNQQDLRYVPLLGNNSELTGVSLQTNYSNVHAHTLKWLSQSANAGKQWVVANDEQGPANLANPPDTGFAGYGGNTTPSQKQMRWMVVWGNLMAGGAGVELYAGYQNPHSDLTLTDFRSRDRMWDYCRHALNFFEDNLPYTEMESANALIGNNSNNNDKYCFAKDGEVYAVYLPNGGTTNLDLSGATGTFDVRWFNPRDGGALQTGSVAQVTGGSSVSLGNAPSDANEDWAILVKKLTVVNSLPFSDDFEGHQNGDGVFQQDGWSVGGSGSAVAQNTTAYEGDLAMELSDQVTATQNLASAADVIWCDLQVRFASTETGTEPNLPNDASAAVFLDEAGLLNVADGSSWTVPAGLQAVAPTEWQRVTVRLDYGAQTYSVWLNDVRIAQDLAFANSVSSFGGIEFIHNSANSTFVDNILAELTEPPLLDNDGDQLTNSWERAHGLDEEDNGSTDPNQGFAGNADGDLFNNFLELAFDLNPSINDSEKGPYPHMSTENSTEYIGIVYRESTGAGQFDFVPECTYDLGIASWSPITTERIVLDPDPDGDGSCQLVEVRTPIDANRKFIRMLVQLSQ
ncbi:MAG: DUF5060 domain-containing protein [Verrucomicrobiota bacterium]